jgi:hypothetical protein
MPARARGKRICAYRRHRRLTDRALHRTACAGAGCHDCDVPAWGGARDRLASVHAATAPSGLAGLRPRQARTARGPRRSAADEQRRGEREPREPRGLTGSWPLHAAGALRGIFRITKGGRQARALQFVGPERDGHLARQGRHVPEHTRRVRGAHRFGRAIVAGQIATIGARRSAAAAARHVVAVARSAPRRSTLARCGCTGAIPAAKRR